LPSIPSEFIGRMLSPIEPGQLEEMLSREQGDRGTDRRRRSQWLRPRD